MERRYLAQQPWQSTWIEREANCYKHLLKSFRTRHLCRFGRGDIGSENNRQEQQAQCENLPHDSIPYSVLVTRWPPHAFVAQNRYLYNFELEHTFPHATERAPQARLFLGT
jgi:hypothetical protein